ncbi:MAG: hypothetical protein ABWZ80_04025 [Beijerinckiaceae bacterium]
MIVRLTLACAVAFLLVACDKCGDFPWRTTTQTCSPEKPTG